jgi:hypothetical protein
MAETKRMTCEQVVGYLLEGEGLDFPRVCVTASAPAVGARVDQEEPGSTSCGVH